MTTLVDIPADVKQKITDFRFQKSSSNAALILKIDKETHTVLVDEHIDDISIDDLQEQLPSHQPRYVIYSYKMNHADGRISYPMCFIYLTPRDSQIELQMLYAGTKTLLQREADLTRSYDIRDLEDLTEDWLRAQLVR